MTREEWLQSGLTLLKKELFVPLRYNVSSEIQVSCGFPSQGALSMKKRRIGECWYPQSTNGVHHLFISPTLNEPTKVLDTLVHEVVHTIVGKKAGHKAPFKYVAVRVGLEGKMTSTHAGSKLEKLLKGVAKEIGTYPHKPLELNLVEKKPGTSVSAKCPKCGYRISTSAKWAEFGMPICPCCEVRLERSK